MPKSFSQFLETTTLAPNLYDEEVNAGKQFELTLGCIEDVIGSIRKALTEPDMAKQELLVMKKMSILSSLFRSAARVFNEYKADQLDIVEES